MTNPPFRSTITQALADTVIDDSRSDDGQPPRPAVDVSSLPDVGDLVGKTYRLVRLLGKGTFGKVYVAERVDVPEHQVALKITLREMYSGRDVERELVMLAAAGHPHMVQLKDHGTTPEFVWFTMPVYEGETLGVRLQRGTLSLREAYEIFVPIARSLEALHRAGLRHQDLKPDNIFLATFGGRIHPIILDLGVAAERASSFVAGTILFAAPEQTIALTGGEVPLNEKMDTYGLAATLLLSLVGMKHFPGANAGTHEEMAAAQQQRAQDPLPDAALPSLQGKPRKMLVDAFRGWFAVDSEMRSSMIEMAEELDVLLEQEREEALAEQRARARQKANLLRTRLAAAAMLVIAIAFLGYAYSKRETLRLADELAQARAVGAESFDKLETCQSAHEVAQKQISDCRALRNKDHVDYQNSLASLSRSGDESTKECTQQVMSLSTKVKTCEDEYDSAKKTWESDREQLVSQHESRQKELASQLEDSQQLAESRADEIEVLKSKVTLCEVDLASCQLEARDNPYDDRTPPVRPPSSAVPAASNTPPPPPTNTTPPAPPPPVPTEDDPFESP